MQKLRQFRDLLFQLKVDEATGVWRALGIMGRWLLTVPGTLLGVLMAILRFIGKVGGATPGFVKRLLLNAPGTISATLADIGTLLLSIISFVWWWFLPGFVSGVGFIAALWAICEASGWMMKLGYVVGILVGLWFYWNVLAASLGTWKKESHRGKTDYLVDAVARMFYGMLIEVGVFAYVMLLIEETLAMVAITVGVLVFVGLLVILVEFLSDPYY